MYRFHSPSGSNNTRTNTVLNRKLTQVLVESGTQTLKTLLGILLGLASMVGGWIIFSSEGFYSPVLFLAGTLMMPLGLLLLGTSITGGFGEGPRSILDRYNRRNREP